MSIEELIGHPFLSRFFRGQEVISVRNPTTGFRGFLSVGDKNVYFSEYTCYNKQGQLNGGLVMRCMLGVDEYPVMFKRLTDWGYEVYGD